MDALQSEKRYTYSDYASWNTEVRYELIDGISYVMESPSVSHQRISGNLFFQLYGFLRDKPCEVFAAPIDVCLNALGDDDDDVVQPDILIVCDRANIPVPVKEIAL